MKTSTSVIQIDAPADRVWDALVNPAKVKPWQHGSELVTTWEIGSPIRFTTPWGDRVFEQWGTVLEVAPPKSLKYSLFAPRPDLTDSPENYFFMTYRIEEDAGRTTLRIIQEDSRPQSGASDGDDESVKPSLPG